MKAYLYFAIGGALLILAVAKLVGLGYLLATGGDAPGAFVAKQAVYAVVAVALGVSAVRAGRDQRVQS